MAAASSVRRTTSRARTTKAVTEAADTDTPKPPKPAAKTKRAPSNALGGQLREAESPSGSKTTPRPAAGSPEECRTAPSKKAKPPATRTRAKPNALVQRVYNTIDGELAKLEKQKGLTSQDRERASRALSQMVNALEKAVEMQREMTKTKRSGGDARSKEALAHAEDLRREIAERLERLNRKRASHRNSE
jgi:hypothetical protein